MTMWNNNKIVILVPTYNESENIELLIKQLNESLPEVKILIVDDNSPDGTSEIVKNLQHKYRNLILITRKENRGRGYAGIEGFKKCLELGAEIIVEMDADLSHSPYEINKMIEELKNSDADIVVGSRYIEGGEDVERSFLRKLISFFARVYINFFTGINLKDITSGFKVYKSNVIKTILPYLKSSDPFIVTEVNFFSKINNFKFKEVPIKFHKRYKGKSKLTSGKLIKYLFKVAKLVWDNFVCESYNLRFVQFMLLTNILRLMLIPLFGLTDDEAHYWQYSQYLDFSYYDHPPMVGYMIYFFTRIFGNTLYGVRLPAVFCFIIASIYFYLLIKKMFNSKIAFYSVILLNSVPIFFVGSIITIPDASLGMFWMMYMYYFYKFVKTYNYKILYFSATLLGFALLSKYTALLLVFSTVIIFLYKKELKKYFLKKEFYIFLSIIIILFLPVILWNFANNFVSFKYQFYHGMGNKLNFSINTFLQNFGSQSIYLSPLLFVFLWYYVITFWKKQTTFEENYLLSFSLVGVIGFNLIGFNNQILPHWPAISYIPLLPSIIFYYKNNWQYISSITVASLLTISVLVITIFGLIKIPKNIENADTPDKLFGWDIAAKETIRFISENNNFFILTHKHYTAGQLRFALAKYYPKNEKNIPKVYCVNDYLDQYDFWNKELCSLNGMDILFVVEGRFPIDDIFKKYSFKNYNLKSSIRFIKSKNWPSRVFEFYYIKNFNCKELASELIQLDYNNVNSVSDYLNNYDKKIFLKINSLSGKFKILDYAMIIFTFFGDGLFIIPVSFVTLFLINNFKIRPTLNDFFVSCIILLTGGVIIQFLKNFFNLPRPVRYFTPMIMNNQVNVRILLQQLDVNGFPSGHTFTIFCFATFLYYKITNFNKTSKFWLTVLFFTVAFLVGISRIYVSAHFPSDVLGGIIVGVFYTYFCLKFKRLLS